MEYVNIYPDHFVDMEFPANREIVYVLNLHIPGDTRLTPFYVGESSRHVGRIGDYVSANFTASTDFKVGEAVKFLRQRGLEVLVRFWECTDRKLEEKRVINILRASHLLLNDFKGYRRDNPDAETQRREICNFMEKLVNSVGGTTEKPVSVAPLVDSQPTLSGGLTIPERVYAMCKSRVGINNEISRGELLRWANDNGISEGSILPADWSNNTVTGRWSKHAFFRSVGRGRYIFLG